MNKSPTTRCKVMWDYEDGSELGIVVVVCEGDTDERIIERAWQQVRHGFHPILRPKNKSDMRVIRRK